MPWLRIDDGFPSHPKIGRLSDRHFRVWIRVLTHAARYNDPTVDEGTMREVMGLDAKAVERFAELRLLDRNGTGWRIHDWDEYSPRTSTERVRRHRETKREG